MGKLKVVSTAVCTLGLVALIGNAGAAHDEAAVDIAAWGQVLNDSAKEETVFGSTYLDSVGENTIFISKADLEQASTYYKMLGMSEKEALKKAKNYCEEYGALYRKAIASGYSVTDEEVNAYVNELREMVENDNLEDESNYGVQAIIEQFESEEDYWNYEKKVYQIMLPVQKYVKALEKEYLKEHTMATDEAWTAHFEKMKSELINQTEFVYE